MQTHPAAPPRRTLAASLALGISLLADTGHAQPADPPARDRRATDLQAVKVTGPSAADLRRDDPTLRNVDYSYSGGGTNRLSAEWTRASTPERTLDVAADWRLDDASRLNLSLSNVLQQRQGSRTVYRDAYGAVSRYYGSDTAMGIKLQYERQL